MRIGIDARAISTGYRGGLSTYVSCLIEHLARMDADNMYYIYIDRRIQAPAWGMDRNFLLRVVGPKARLLREDVTLPWRMWQDQVDVAHFPANVAPVYYPRRYIVTMHDTVTSSYRRAGPRTLAFRDKMRYEYEGRVSPAIAKRARLILTDSDYSKRQLGRVFGIPERKIRVIHLAPQVFPPVRSPDSSLAATLTGRFVLALGSLDPRKNVERLILAFRDLLRTGDTGHSLVIVSTYNSPREAYFASLDDSPSDRRILIVPAVSAADLRWLYSEADLFVFPSLHEGFGIPPLEAMMCGTPVVCSNCSSLPEVVGDAAMLVDPYHIQQIAGAMWKVLTNSSLRADLTRKGFTQASKFSWDAVARRVLQAYQEAHAGD